MASAWDEVPPPGEEKFPVLQFRGDDKIFVNDPKSGKTIFVISVEEDSKELKAFVPSRGDTKLENPILSQGPTSWRPIPKWERDLATAIRLAKLSEDEYTTHDYLDRNRLRSLVQQEKARLEEEEYERERENFLK